MTALYDEKMNSKGKCKEDPLLANIKNFVEQSVTTQIASIKKLIETKSKEIATESINNNELLKAIGIYMKTK